MEENNMVKVLTACGNGMGSSMVIKMKVETLYVTRKMILPSIHVVWGEAMLASGYDIVIASLHFDS